MKKVTMAVMAVVAIAFLTGCADQIAPENVCTVSAVGFWHGLWHGMVLPISWIGSMFSDNIAIYNIANNGGWYDFGFILGAGVLASSASTATNK